MTPEQNKYGGWPFSLALISFRCFRPDQIAFSHETPHYIFMILFIRPIMTWLWVAQKDLDWISHATRYITILEGQAIGITQFLYTHTDGPKNGYTLKQCSIMFPLKLSVIAPSLWPSEESRRKWCGCDVPYKGCALHILKDVVYNRKPSTLAALWEEIEVSCREIPVDALINVVQYSSLLISKVSEC